MAQLTLFRGLVRLRMNARSQAMWKEGRVRKIGKIEGVGYFRSGIAQVNFFVG